LNEITLDAAGWQSADDVYSAFFHAVGAPPWHGRNLDALRDSIGAGHINVIAPPIDWFLETMARPGRAPGK